MSHQRGARLAALLVLLAVISGAAIYLRQGPDRATARRASLLDTPLDDPQLQPEAPASALLELAQRTADDLVRDYPNNVHALSVQARRHYSLNETDRAIVLWRECLEHDPDFADAFFGLGLVALDRGEYAEASQRFEDVARIDGDDPRVPVLRAKALFHGGRNEDALLILEHHVATEQTSAEAWELLGQIHFQSQNYERAVECFHVAVDALPSMKEAVYGLWRAYAALGDKQNADLYAAGFRELGAAAHAESSDSIEQYTDRNLVARTTSQTLVDAARVRRMYGETQQAEALLLRAVHLKPKNTHYLEELQKSLQLRSAYSEAAEVGERIVELDPAKLEQWLNLAWLYSHLERPEQALAACKRAIDLDPNDPRCREAYEVVRRAE
jgi:tetratricopeptide (TPR) repeat protein